MTPYELTCATEAYVERKEMEAEHEAQQGIINAWMGEYYHRTKTLPSLKDELIKLKRGPNGEMSNDEMLNMAKSLNAQFGGDVVPKKDGE
jgi:hypothetical protein